MWFRDPERRKARQAVRDQRASYRVAGWSRLDLSGLAVALTSWMALLPLAFMPGRQVALIAALLITIGGTLPFAVLALRRDDLVRIDEGGLFAERDRSSEHAPSVRVALQDIAGIEVRDWHKTLDPKTGKPVPLPASQSWVRVPRTICVRMTDGTYVEVFARRRHARRPVLLERRGRRWRWRPARQPGGARLVWTEATDQVVADAFTERIAALRRALGLREPRARRAEDEPIRRVYPGSFRLDAHRRMPPSRPHERKAYSTSAFGTDAPVPQPAPDPLPPAPPELPELRPPVEEPGSPETPGTARFTDLVFPTRYWTLASERAGSVLGRRPAMLIDQDGITFTRRTGRPRTFALKEMDRFDLTFDATTRPEDETPGRLLDGNWRLVLLLADGTRVPLSGLDHGYFKDNRLFWATGDRAAGSGAVTPDDSLPWPNDQPRLVAARLNAHLDAARGLPGSVARAA